MFVAFAPALRLSPRYREGMLSYNLPLSYADKLIFQQRLCISGDEFRGVTTLSFIEIESSLNILWIGDVVSAKFIAYLTL